MMLDLVHITVWLIMLPLIMGSVVGLFGHYLKALPSQLLTILGMLISLALSAYLCYQIIFLHHANIDQMLYTWGSLGTHNQLPLDIGIYIDPLSVMMALVVSFVSFLVHIYSIGYMSDDDSKQRFFCYISLFTFAMLVLVFSNNFLPLFFGWEGVGLMSYLLIGFWFKRESANQASLKAFLVNRISDLAFLMGIAGVYATCHSLSFQQVFPMVPSLATQSLSIVPNHSWSIITIIGVLIFIGAMGKSAQIPLHVWLPESMEGPTPISALIHAATMVTAGIYLLARLSPLYEYSTAALSFVMIIGATTALFMGLVGIVQNDIKRVIAYSTLSQLGYMMAGLGASAFSASIFHLFTHACFKALLFLAAGSVIIAMHHEQDIQKMGGLAKKMPVTYVTFLIGALALIALPPTSGFYSKDSIINAVHFSTLTGATYVYWCLLLGVFVTALYTFRCFFLVFHTSPRMSDKTAAHVHETSHVMLLPLILLAIPSLLMGLYLIKPLLVSPSWFGNSLYVLPQYDTVTLALQHFTNAIDMAVEALTTPAFWLSIGGIFVAWLAYILKPNLPASFAKNGSWIYRILVDKYGFDRFNDLVFVDGSKKLAAFCFEILDIKLIDDVMVNGSGKLINYLSRLSRKLQSGYLYQYALLMVLGLLALLVWQVYTHRI